jgi:uncharacterized protein
MTMSTLPEARRAKVSQGGDGFAQSGFFTRSGSSLESGLSLGVPQFVAADPRDLVAQLRRFVERTSWRAPSAAEIASWSTSIPALQRLLDDERLRGLVILLEASIPRGLGRIDCVLLGSRGDGRNSVVILELKAWSDAKKAPDPSDMLVPVPIGVRGPEPKVHPSRQALGYRAHLTDLVVACHDADVSAAAWLYNAGSCARSPFDDCAFADFAASAPCFGGSQMDELRSYVAQAAPSAPSAAFLQQLDASTISPSTTLMERFTARLSDFPGMALTDDQIEAFHRIVSAYDPRERRVIVVRGGPGSGKTVLALQLLREFYARGIGAVYSASSQAIINAYTTAFRESTGVFANSATLGRSKVPVQIVDEAHRLRDRKQIKSGIESAQLSVFLIDDRQIILPGDITGHREITESAATVCGRRAAIVDLAGDKRSGSDAYGRWIDAVLGVRPDESARASPAYCFEIVDSPQEMESKLRCSGGEWRIVAGICWPRTEPTSSGELAEDVSLPQFEYFRAWSGNPKKLAGSPLHTTALCWASEPAARDYVGNVYTAQSFEFDYVGVIFGHDLVVRNGRWVAALDAHPKSDSRFYSSGAAYKRPARARDCLQNIYRVLLTRGRKGCFVLFVDPETRRHFERRVKT